MNRASRVLILGEFPECNGGENSLLAILPALQASGWQFESLAPDGTFADRLRAFGCRHHSVEWQCGGQKLPLDERRQKMTAAIKGIAPDIVHANSLSIARDSGPVCRDLSIPSVGYLRDIVGVSRRVADDVGQHDRLIAVSNATREFHIGQGMPAQKIQVVFNGIDCGVENVASSAEDSRPFHIPEIPVPEIPVLEMPVPEMPVPEMPVPEMPVLVEPVPDERFVVGGVGQIGLRKGWDRLLEAAEIVARQRPDICWMIAGTRHSDKAETIEWEEELHLRSQSVTLQGRFHWLGRVQDMAAFYKRLDMLVHPARQEPLGRTLLEAAARGIPIVATDVGGTREIFPPDSRSAILCPVDDASALASAMLHLRDEQQEAASMASRARARIESEFTVLRCAQQVDDIYRQLLRR